ncbi:crotonobetainyl-CoA:carnitine CoA-transferase CaiB-like acyl-CoA transferase [Altererythrobacter atlanticus]|uniref:Formyl-coenzyme A transferase n=1 Tax=Croceibacterium atlanticum TaxID=1267766 RepID=A0A0F7KQR1_9SPHN|nr:CoA transferase [Croceibacterium atlanticum]AKH41512.1 Formyl-coenzyme A transferase [Croceibacterium atlanticum]MBB5732974.1 crotonobetainyl-CoA:carnitine CoA-transferase CaiB-like acyl-CoA transferase [Croceibacterium atlanticum]
MSQPLAGFRVADFSHVMAGPFASHLLRLMGAEVIKIESRNGDQFRNYGADRRFDGMSPAFIAANVGKKSIALDLKDPEEQEIARKIVANSDVLLENFRPGVIARLGFGYDAVGEWKHDIVYCSVSGYGQKSEQRDWPAIDNIVQATSGMMMLSGAEGDPPVRIGFPIVDTLTGQTAAVAILGALLQRERTGQGAYIDVSMLDAAMAFMTSALTPYLVTGQTLKRLGNTGYSGLPTAALFETADNRHVSLGVVQENQFAALCRHLGREDWLKDPRFATPDARRANFDAMFAQLEKIFRTRDADQWERELSAVNIPCGKIRHVGEAAELCGSQALLDVNIEGLPGDGAVAVPNAGFDMEPGAPGTAEPPPRLDQNREEILQWLASLEE